jgi:hypothetical protein
MDIFDKVATLRADSYAIFRGDSLPYANEGERLLNGKLAQAGHRAALAHLMREGGDTSEFKQETMHLHGGSSHGMPLEMALAFGHDEALTGEMCWRIVLHCSNMPAEPWPKSVSAELFSRPPSNRPNRLRGRPKGSGSLAPKDEPLVAKMDELLSSGQATSVQNAATSLAKIAAGSGTLESKRDRLVRRYSAEYKSGRY